METHSNTQPKKLPFWITLIAFALLGAFLYMLARGLMQTMQGSAASGQVMPDFSLPTFDGGEFNTADHPDKLIVVNFWASWCLPCEEEAAELEEAWRALEPGGKVIFVGVNYVDTEPEALAYLEKYQITYPNGPDLGTRISRSTFRMSGVPETYILGLDRQVQFVKKGPFASTGEIIAVIEGLLEEE